MMMANTQIEKGFTASHLSVASGQRNLVSDLTLHVQPGTWTNLTGPSSGDTSRVLAALSGRRPRTAGTLFLDGEPLPTAPTPDLVGYVSRSHTLVATLTASETLMVTLIATGHHIPAQLLRRAEKQLQALALPSQVWHNLLEQLSGGQQQRVALAQALVSRPRLLVLDDPTSELDPDTSELVATLLTQAVSRGACCITATRDESLRSRAHRAISLQPQELSHQRT